MYQTRSSFNLFNNIAGLCLILACVMLFGCKSQKPLNQVEAIKKKGEIRVGMLYGPTSYYIDKEGPTGFIKFNKVPNNSKVQIL